MPTFTSATTLRAAADLAPVPVRLTTCQFRALDKELADLMPDKRCVWPKLPPPNDRQRSFHVLGYRLVHVRATFHLCMTLLQTCAYEVLCQQLTASPHLRDNTTAAIVDSKYMTRFLKALKANGCIEVRACDLVLMRVLRFDKHTCA